VILISITNANRSVVLAIIYCYSFIRNQENPVLSHKHPLPFHMINEMSLMFSI
jgi:hypothetical protein